MSGRVCGTMSFGKPEEFGELAMFFQSKRHATKRSTVARALVSYGAAMFLSFGIAGMGSHGGIAGGA